MAYTIIGQNNSVTTIDDGNGHTLHVPSRVALAIGTTFTIVEVNNNMATLEDSNGKVYRDIPCVVDLVGSGGGGGGSSLPDQTGHSGEFLTTDGTDASWSDKPLVNKAVQSSSVVINTNPGSTTTQASGQYNTMLGYGARVDNAAAAYNIIIGYGANVSGDKKKNVLIGYTSESYSNNGIAIGYSARVNADNAIQLGNIGGSVALNSDANTFKVANANGNYEMMSSDGTIPTARLTKVNSTVTIAVADWNGGTTVTKTVAGITATGVVMVAPDPTDQADYTSAGIICTAQAADSLTFTATTTPTADIDVNVVML